VESAAAGAEDPSILCAELNDALDQLSNLECDMDTLDQRLAAALSANQAQAAKLKDIEHRHGMDQISLTLLRSTMSSATITIDNMKYVHAAELRELTLSCKKSTAKEVQRALKDLKAEQRESEASYGQKIVSLQRELEDARQPADERAVKMELKVVQLQAKAKKQTEQAVKFSRIVDEMVEGLNGETIEDLMERAQTAEEDKQLGWERCRILQKHTDEAKGDLVKAEAVVKERDGEVKALTEKLYLTNLVLATVKQERRRDGKGDIFHEEGRVLVRCDLCMEVRGGLIYRCVSYSDSLSSPLCTRSSLKTLSPTSTLSTPARILSAAPSPARSAAAWSFAPSTTSRGSRRRSSIATLRRTRARRAWASSARRATSARSIWGDLTGINHAMISCRHGVRRLVIRRNKPAVEQALHCLRVQVTYEIAGYREEVLCPKCSIAPQGRNVKEKPRHHNVR